MGETAMEASDDERDKEGEEDGKGIDIHRAYHTAIV